MAEFERQRAAGAAAEAAVHERRVAAAALRTRAAGEAAFAAAKQARVVLAMASGGEGRTNVIELSADVLALIIAKLPFSRKMIDKAPTCRAFAHAVRLAVQAHRRVCYEGHRRGILSVAAASVRFAPFSSLREKSLTKSVHHSLTTPRHLPTTCVLCSRLEYTDDR